MVDILWRLLWLDIVGGWDILQVPRRLPHHLSRQLSLVVVGRGSAPGDINRRLAAFEFGRDVLDGAAARRRRPRLDLSDRHGQPVDKHVLGHLFDLLLALHLRFQ